MQLYYLETIKIVLIQENKQVHVNKYGTVRILTTMYWYWLHCWLGKTRRQRKRSLYLTLLIYFDGVYCSDMFY